MKKIISFEGYCPHQEVRYSIQITYSEYSPLGARFFVKNTFKCPYQNQNLDCSIAECPIYKSSPEEL